MKTLIIKPWLICLFNDLVFKFTVSSILKAKKVKTSLGFQASLKMLEEAHLLAQPYGWPHLVVHYEMFLLSLEFKQWNEVLGQIPRMFLALPGSWLRKAPKGNVGSTKMGIFEKAKDDK